MTPQQHHTPVSRSPFWAGLLSVVATGLGHIYCGRIEKGLILFFISLAFSPIIASSIAANASSISLFTLIGALLVLAFVFFYAIVDAVIIAKDQRSGYMLKEYNRWYIYLAVIIVSFTYPTNLANTIRDHVVQAYKIVGDSMTPSILKGDCILINKMVYKKQSPRSGDVVVFVNPNKRHMDYIKRIVALPGDSVEIRENILYINDFPLVYRPVADSAATELPPGVTGAPMIEKNGPVAYGIMHTGKVNPSTDMNRTIVPNGFCFVLGDNRNDSEDSRSFGPVPLADIKGRVDYIYLPAASWSRFGPYENLK